MGESSKGGAADTRSAEATPSPQPAAAAAASTSAGEEAGEEAAASTAAGEEAGAAAAGEAEPSTVEDEEVQVLWAGCSSTIQAMEHGADMLKQLALLMAEGVGTEQDVHNPGTPLVVGIGQLRHTHSEGPFYSIQEI